MSRRSYASEFAIGFLAALVLPSAALAGPSSEQLRYQAESRFHMDSDLLGVPVGKKIEKVKVRTEMNLACTRGEISMTCRIENPEVAWNGGKDDVRGWDKKVENDLDGASVRMHWNRFGGLETVELATRGPANAPYAALRQTVVERAIAGFDLPLGASDDPNADLAMETRLVPALRPTENARHRLEHHVESVPTNRTKEITTRGAIAWLGDLDSDAGDDRYKGKVEAEAIWDEDENHLIRRRWKSELGGSWYGQTGSVRLLEDDDGEPLRKPIPDDTEDPNGPR